MQLWWQSVLALVLALVLVLVLVLVSISISVTASLSLSNSILISVLVVLTCRDWPQELHRRPIRRHLHREFLRDNMVFRDAAHPGALLRLLLLRLLLRCCSCSCSSPVHAACSAATPDLS